MKRAIVDLSSIIWASLKNGIDPTSAVNVLNADGSFTLKKDGTPLKVNGAQWGYDHAIDYLLMVLDELKIQPRDTILAVEGQNSKALRRFILPTYKEGRDHHPEEYIEFQKVREALVKAFLSVGAQAVTQDGVEADDVVGYLAKHLLGERWVISNDKDLAWVVSVGAHHYRRGEIDQNPFGPFEHRYLPVYIALVGDSVDKISGAPGFGPGAFSDVMTAFSTDCLKGFETLISEHRLQELAEDVEACAKSGQKKAAAALQKIVDGASAVYTSWELGRLHLDKVNTLRRPLQWTVGMVNHRTTLPDPRLNRFGGVVKLISREVAPGAWAWAGDLIRQSPYITLDIETSTPPESDEWLQSQKNGEGKDTVDVFGSELTSLQMSFGPNMQYTVYLPIDNIEEPGVSNLTTEEAFQFLELIPSTMWTVVHNSSFELPVCAMSFGELFGTGDTRYREFLRNVVDSQIMANYVNENESVGLKSLSDKLLGYTQTTYEQVVSASYTMEAFNALPLSSMGERGAIKQEHEVDGVVKVDVVHKMNQLPARKVLSYGADDCICTAAVTNHFMVVMELEGTWDVFMEVEQFASYLVAKSFLTGAEFDLAEMAAMEADDNKDYDAAWAVVRSYLIKIGYEGSVFAPIPDLSPASIKRAAAEACGVVLATNLRRVDKLVELMKSEAALTAETEHVDDGFLSRVELLASFIAAEDLGSINEMVSRNFKGEPVLNLGSSKRMCEFLYDHLGLPVRIIGEVTEKEKTHKDALVKACYKHKRKRAGREVTMTPEDLELIRQKASSNEVAILTAAEFDSDLLDNEKRSVLKAMGRMKKVETRRSLYYKNYWSLKHWKDGRIHGSEGQSRAVTRRFTPSNPNKAQLPKKGEAVRFRKCFVPHKRRAVVCSADYTGQELRLAAEKSQDPNMLACYVGDNLRDIHSLTAAYAMRLKWGHDLVEKYRHDYGPKPEGWSEADWDYHIFLRLRALGKADLVGKRAEDLRKDSKNVNFTAQFGGQAPKIADRLIMRVEDAQLFLDARSAMFPLVDLAAKKAEERCLETGRAYTFMGGIRHLGHSISSGDRSEASRAARQAWNMEIQGSAAEMMKLGMGRLWLSGAMYDYDAQFIGVVHDELVTSVVEEDATAFIRIKNKCMTQKYSTMNIPVLASISLGPNYGDQIECGDWFIEENVKAAAWLSVEGKSRMSAIMDEAKHCGKDLLAYVYAVYVNPPNH